MTKSQALETIFTKLEAITNISSALAVNHWDAATNNIPEKSLAARGASIGWLSGEIFSRIVSPDTIEAVDTLETYEEELSEQENAMVREIGRTARKMQAVPPEEFQAFSAITAQGEAVWATAREKNDFSIIEPYYEKIFTYQRKLCDWYGYSDNPYDALLDDYEKGASVKVLDRFFSELKEKIVPLVKKIGVSDIKPREIKGSFDIAKQRTLTPWLTEFVGYDSSRGCIGEVAHPFTLSVNRNDVRISTKYHEDSLLSSIYSVIHESGHAIYEQNMDEGLVKYGLADGSSMGLHESQSRLYENIFCRSRAFASQLLPRLKEIFSYFNDWDEDSFYRAINISRPSLIRIEADELTYPLHIMVRYELEKAIIAGEIKISDLPRLWNDKYEEILGIRPESDANGVMQDVHWSGGMVGYFPSYAIGTAYGAQIVNSLKKTVDLDSCMKSGNLSKATKWLNENIHSCGAMKLPDEILKQATGEPFNAKYYVDYLSDKFTELYLN